MIEDENEEYQRRMAEVNKRLEDEAVTKKIDGYLAKISKLVGCEVELIFKVEPYLDDYLEMQDSDDFYIPKLPTLKLHEFVDHLQRERDGNLNVYIDPLHLSKGVNEIKDVLITTQNSTLIIVPISSKK